MCCMGMSVILFLPDLKCFLVSLHWIEPQVLSRHGIAVVCFVPSVIWSTLIICSVVWLWIFIKYNCHLFLVWILKIVNECWISFRSLYSYWYKPDIFSFSLAVTSLCCVGSLCVTGVSVCMFMCIWFAIDFRIYFKHPLLL